MTMKDPGKNPGGLTVTVQLGKPITVIHGGEELKIFFWGKNGHNCYKVQFAGPKSFFVDRGVTKVRDDEVTD